MLSQSDVGEMLRDTDDGREPADEELEFIMKVFDPRHHGGIFREQVLDVRDAWLRYVRQRDIASLFEAMLGSSS